MNETAGMLEARLRLLDRLRAVEHALARAEQATIAAALLRGRSHELGNLVQIVKLSAEVIAQRNAAEAELVSELRSAAEQAGALLGDMFAAARPTPRSELGPVVSHAIHAAFELARPAFAAALDLRIELDDTVHTHSTAEELEAMVIAALLDASTATRLSIVVRKRVIESRPWVELLRMDDRQLGDGELAHMFEPHSLLHLVTAAAKQAGGETSLAPGRTGLELAIALPVAQSSSSS